MSPSANPALSAAGHEYPVVGTAEGPGLAKTRDCVPKRESETRVRSLNIAK